MFGAHLYITNATQKRKKTLLRSFPDGLDLMVVCVESGLALDAAINRVCAELAYAHPQLAKELNRTRLELALLNNRSQALANLAERTDLVAFRSLAAALIQTERFGTNLTDTLRVLSDDYRQTRLMQAEEKAGRLPAMMAVPLITLLLPALVLIILGPPFVELRAQGGLFGNN
jgi:tight adherence protein C